jgi:hypothetical protein
MPGGGGLGGFRYRSQFAPRAIWLAVKRNKVGAYLHLYLAPGQPLLCQYVLQRSLEDGHAAATYDTWIRAHDKVPNPGVRLPEGGSQAVARKMLELAPELGSNEQTARAASIATRDCLPPSAPAHLAPAALARGATPRRPPSRSAAAKRKRAPKSPDSAASAPAARAVPDKGAVGVAPALPPLAASGRLPATAAGPTAAPPAKKKRGRPPKPKEAPAAAASPAGSLSRI